MTLIAIIIDGIIIGIVLSSLLLTGFIIYAIIMGLYMFFFGENPKKRNKK